MAKILETRVVVSVLKLMDQNDTINKILSYFQIFLTKK